MGAINLYLGDCMEAMAEMKENEYDLAIVDPPYGISINNNMGRRKGEEHSGYKKIMWDESIPDCNYFNKLKSVSENQIVWGGNYMTDFLPPSPCWILWDKGFSEDVSFAQFEMAWTSFSRSAKKYDKTPLQPNRIHPTQKPVKLYEWLLMNYAKPGQKILDTHGGSMSIAIAVHNVNEREGMNLSLDLWEIDEEYYNAGVARYENHIRQKTIFS